MSEKSRFPKAVMEGIRQRELLALALEEQEQAMMRRARIWKMIAVGSPLIAATFILSGAPLPSFDFAQKSKRDEILAKVSQQVKQGDKVMIGGEGQTGTANTNYAKNDNVDAEIQALEARDAKMAAFVKNAPKKQISEEQMMKMAERAEAAQNGSATSAPSGPTTGATLSASVKERGNALDAAAEDTVSAPLAANAEPSRAPASAAIPAPASTGQDSPYIPARNEELAARFPEEAQSRAPAALPTALPSSVKAPPSSLYRQANQEELNLIALDAPKPGGSAAYERLVNDPYLFE